MIVFIQTCDVPGKGRFLAKSEADEKDLPGEWLKGSLDAGFVKRKVDVVAEQPATKAIVNPLPVVNELKPNTIAN